MSRSAYAPRRRMFRTRANLGANCARRGPHPMPSPDAPAGRSLRSRTRPRRQRRERVKEEPDVAPSQTSFWNRKNQRDPLFLNDAELVACIPCAVSHTDSGSRECLCAPRRRGPNRNRRDFTIEPILLLGERRPGVRHARVAPVGGLSLRPLCERKTVVGIIPENVRLFHGQHLGMELWRRNRSFSIVTFRELRAPSVIADA